MERQLLFHRLLKLISVHLLLLNRYKVCPLLNAFAQFLVELSVETTSKDDGEDGENLEHSTYVW